MDVAPQAHLTPLKNDQHQHGLLLLPVIVLPPAAAQLVHPWVHGSLCDISRDTMKHVRSVHQP